MNLQCEEMAATRAVETPEPECSAALPQARKTPLVRLGPDR
jgi:hypothetical protein